MSDNHPPAEPSPVHLSKNPVSMSAEAISNHCTRIKQEIYKLRSMIEDHPHAEVRAQAIALFNDAHNAFQSLQTFIQSR